ncbi:hypothetical protein RchiOBHm_Chr4g0441591 [Rosa chinensis]|uniref:Clavata3/ESR (CLE) gene family member n=1 Tax=Rosa chinensis TaxID=74649 RepID=A0A2P6R3C1_ROSCH|nr:hypothetical protein RchiOBHm_Chr4g0441591 [Rosa chinensis]
MRSATEGLILLLWVVLILAQTTTSVFVGHNSISGQESATTGRLISSPPRKARFHDKVSFHAPSSTPSREFFARIHGGDPADKLYGEDKRIVHTGPNPLHN